LRFNSAGGGRTRTGDFPLPSDRVR
jgi:hypothetical protein